MAHPQREREPAIRLSPAEERFLKAFVRKQVFPTAAVLGSLLLAAAFALVVTGRIVVTPVDDASSETVQARAAAIAELQDLQRTTQSRLAQASSERKAAKERLAEIQTRLDGLESRARILAARVEQPAAKPAGTDGLEARLKRLEARVASLAAAPPASPAVEGSAGSAPSEDALASLRERLFNLERRQDRQESMRESFEQGLLERMEAVESQRHSQQSERLNAEKATQERLFNVEARLEALESQR